ncbi:MAG: TIM barrel protein [Clostridia bacterium]|nr:TIM barrel protein [Clostridia bacterium]
MIRFGPGGNPNDFYEQGYKSTFEIMKWLFDMGLNAYEYQCGRGVLVQEESARKIGEQAKLHDIAMSLHAPYFINLAGEDEEKLEKSKMHILKSVEAAKWMGADRVIIHPGSLMKDTRANALDRALKVFREVCDDNDDAVTLCPELMGKEGQLGNIEEIIALSNVDERVIPTIDFGHLNARTLGALNSVDAFDSVVKQFIDGIGLERTRKMHVHFSRIEYTGKGEKRHWTMEDVQFGPDFNHLIPVLYKYEMEPIIICESDGTMAKDALLMKEMYKHANHGN